MVTASGGNVFDLNWTGLLLSCAEDVRSRLRAWEPPIKILLLEKGDTDAMVSSSLPLNVLDSSFGDRIRVLLPSCEESDLVFFRIDGGRFGSFFDCCDAAAASR